MNMKQWNIRRVLQIAGLLFAGMALGWLFFGGGSGSSTGAGEHDHAASTETHTIWTCSMHPQIQQDEPGLCPICGMELIPLDKDASADSPDRLQMTEEAVQAANIRTVRVQKELPYREIRLPGKVQPDETREAEITARVAGRIEKLFVNTTGQRVGHGQKLAELYSPDLIAAQKELLEAVKMKDRSPAYLDAARSKLRYWDLTDEQISAIEQSGQVRRTLDILSPQAGTVLMRHVSEGDYVREGQSLFAIADLSRVWLQFDAYESDLAWLREGMPMQFTLAAVPGREFEARISFIDPVIDPSTRVAHVRVEMQNSAGLLKPEMFATGHVKSLLEGKEKALVIPRSAVLWTGERSVVWVRDPESPDPVFHYREVRLGAEAGDSYIVESGLGAGERVVAQGTFSLDAAAQLQGKASMMNPAAAAGMDRAHGMPHGHVERMRGVPADFRRQLHTLFSSYEKISEALIASDPSAVPKAAVAMREMLPDMGTSGLSDRGKLRWAELRKSLTGDLESLQQSRDLEKQRLRYAELGGQLQAALTTFGVEGDTVYLAYCPMAFNDDGAYWLTSSPEIRNPYFGDAMLKCGVVKGAIGTNEARK
ncbi:efflux RND transporter periplasmic adaptor subunit [bacterium]|nr:efflux RND transporter periplasmic adaptor subunit [bacterium]